MSPGRGGRGGGWPAAEGRVRHARGATFSKCAAKQKSRGRLRLRQEGIKQLGRGTWMRRVGEEEWYGVLSEARRAGSLTILVGSAISKFPPTLLATGWEAATEIRRLLLEELIPEATRDGARREHLKWCIEEFPFESVMAGLARVRSPAVADSLIRELFSAGAHNPAHEMLAQLMLERTALAVSGDPPLVVVTTNYDCGIETACDHLAKGNCIDARYHRVVRKEDQLARARGSSVLYKIHGSVDCDVAMVYTHEQEARLESWRYRLLRNWVDGRTLLILGYSGRDLDVCPALNSCRPIRVLAPRPLDRLQDDPRGFESLMEKLWILPDERTDLRVPLERLTNRTPGLDEHADDARESEGRLASVGSAMHVTLDRGVMRRWLGHLLVHTGAWQEGLEVLGSLEGDLARPSLLYAEERPDALFYGGKYVRAAEAKRELLKREGVDGSWAWRVGLSGSTAGFLNCAGDAVGAWRAILSSVPDVCRLLARVQVVTAGAAAMQLLVTGLETIPLLSMFPGFRRIASAVVRVLRYFGALGPALVLGGRIEPLGPEASLVYLTLGQRVAQVNVFRYRALACAARYRSTGEASDAGEAETNWECSFRVAIGIGDAPGLAKGFLGLGELCMLHGADEEADADLFWREAWSWAREVELVGWRRAVAYRCMAWADDLAAARVRGRRLRAVRSLAGRALSVG